MAEEAKQEKKVEAKKIVPFIFKGLLGLVFLGLGIWAIIGWWSYLWIVIRGCIGLFLILAALIMFAIAKE